MNTIKTYAPHIIAGLLVGSLAACSGTTTPQDTTTEANQTTVQDAVAQEAEEAVDADPIEADDDAHDHSAMMHTEDNHADDSQAEETDHSEETDHNHGAEGSLTAHVHGEGQLVVVKTETGYSANFIAPLASLGLDPSVENEADLPKTITENWLKSDDAAGCDVEDDQTIIAIDRLGDHGELDMDFSFVCTDLDALKSVDLTLFSRTNALESVAGLVIKNGTQSNATLTKQNPTLIFN